MQGKSSFRKKLGPTMMHQTKPKITQSSTDLSPKPSIKTKTPLGLGL